jgi:hypothetical protein
MPDDAANTRAEALQMSYDLVEMIDSEEKQAAGTATPGQAIRDYVRALLRAELALEQERLKRISLLEEAGRRIIDGGQTGEDSWEINDWRSGEVIASGTDGLAGYNAAGARLDPDGTWFHIDHADGDEDEDAEPVDRHGVPESLANALQDWLGMTLTPDEDVAVVVGWSVEEVQRHREYEG